MMSENIDHDSKLQTAGETGESYIWDSCTVRLSITFLPAERGLRRVIVGCNTHNDPPIIETVSEEELGGWPLLVTALLDQLKLRLAERAAQSFNKQQAEITVQQNAELTPQKLDENCKLLLHATQDVSSTMMDELQEEMAGNATPLSEANVAIPVNGKQQSLFG